MNTQSTLRRPFFDRDGASARARLSALAEALRRRGVGVNLDECIADCGHVIALNAGGRDGIVIVAVQREDGAYEGSSMGNPPVWLLAHFEAAWREIA